MSFSWYGDQEIVPGTPLVNDNLDAETVNVSCPRCERKITTKLGKLRRKSVLACWGCGNMFTADPSPIEQTLREAGAWMRTLGGEKPDG